MRPIEALPYARAEPYPAFQPQGDGVGADLSASGTVRVCYHSAIQIISALPHVGSMTDAEPQPRRLTGALIVTFRVLAILVSLCGVLVGVLLVLDDPGLVSVFAGKLVEGGMWSGLAVFVLMAIALGCWPRDADGRLRGLSARQR